MIVFHDPRCVEYVRAGHPERPGRIIGSVALLRDRHPDWAWQRPAAATYEALQRARIPLRISTRLKKRSQISTRIRRHTRGFTKHAARAPGAAIEVPCKALRGDRASLRYVVYTAVHGKPLDDAGPWRFTVLRR